MEKYTSEKDCFLSRIPIELVGIIKGIFEDEKLKEETVGYRYKKQMLEWSRSSEAKDKNIKLLYKATRDGWKCLDFRTRCDNQGETWTVIEDVNSNVFGGYTSFSWGSDQGWLYDSSAYIFTIKNPYSIPPTKYTLSDDEYSRTRSIYDREFHPTFGSGPDIHIGDDSNHNRDSYTYFPSSYDDTTGKESKTFTGDTYFKSNEIEVWGYV